MFLQNLRAKNNKSSYGVLRLKTRLQGANCSDLTTNPYSPVVEVKGRFLLKVLRSLSLTGVLDYQKYIA